MGDTIFTWNSKKQSIIILLTREDEYVATTTCHCKEIIEGIVNAIREAC